MKKNIFLIFSVLFLFSSPIFLHAVRLTPLKGTFGPSQVLSNMSPGWNLGNTLDAIPTESSWNNKPVVPGTLDVIKNAGFKSVRLPVTWTHHTGPAPEYKIDPEWMNRVEQVADMALERGFYVMLNMHHDSWEWASKMSVDTNTGRYMDNFEINTIRMEKIWAQIAERFKSKSQKLMLEILNEPSDGQWEITNSFAPDPQKPKDRHTLSAAQCNEQMNRCLKVIRKTGGANTERLVVITGQGTDPEKTMNGLVLPKDQNLIVTVHYYAPWDFIAQWWGRTSWGTEKDLKELDDLFGRLENTYIKKGMPVIIGEWGTFENIEPHAKWFYHDAVASCAWRHGMTCMIWDNGNGLDRQNEIWHDPVWEGIIVNAGLGIPNSFIDPVEVWAQKGKVADALVRLDLKGNAFSSIMNGSNTLVKGTDYEVSGTTNIVIKDGYLKKVINKFNEFGEFGRLTFKFNKGASQVLFLRNYDKPVLEQKEIKISDYSDNQDINISCDMKGCIVAKVRVLTIKGGRPIKDEWAGGYVNLNDDYAYDDSSLTLKSGLVALMKKDCEVTIDCRPAGNVVKVKMIK